MKKVLKQLFAFLASVQLAVVLLLTLAAVLMVGTFVESIHDTEAAHYYVYKNWWFVSLLVLLGINVFCAGLSRYPWKRHHLGFLTVHLGILILLTGSLITLFWGYEGQLIIPEGEKRGRIFLSNSSLYFFQPRSGRMEEIPTQFRFTPPTEDHPAGGKVLGDILVRINDFYPNAQMKIAVEEGGADPNPAVNIALQGSRASMEEWLFARDYEKQRMDLGPAAIQFFELPQSGDLKRVIQNKEMRGPILSIGKSLIPLKTSLGQAISYQGGEIIPKNFFSDGVVYQGRLLNRGKDLKNPVALVTWISPQGKEQDLAIFSKYSHLGAVPLNQGKMPQVAFKDLRLFYIPPQFGSQENELALVKLDSGAAIFALKQGGTWSSIRNWERDSSVKTGWMDFAFSVPKIIHRAKVTEHFRPVAVPKGKDGPPPAVHIQMARQGELEDFWLGRGQSKSITLGKENLEVAYALKSIPLGFLVKLIDFKMNKYEGTSDPSSYESKVTLLDEAQGIQEDHLISMNEPLAYRGFKIFQASYQLGEGGPDWSVFSVAYDPGVPIKYLGSIILILGIVIIFYFRKAYARNPKKVKKLEKENSGFPLNPYPVTHE